MLEQTVAEPSSSLATQPDSAGVVRIAVVIPFFQRATGILARALQSIKDQRFTQNVAVDVLIVDDCSPLSPEGECTDAAFDDPIRLRIITRPNGGPGAARNTALDAIDPSTDYVAFLDSDDIWQPDHLQHAVDALGQNCDFYFCDHHSAGSSNSYFFTLGEEQVRLKLKNALVPGSDQGKLDDRLVYLDDRSASLAIVRRYLAHTSTIVFRRAPMAELRFFEKLRFAGEDYLFSLELARAARKTCCSQRLNVHRGNGIDLYTGSCAWNHPNRPRVLLDDLKCFIRAKTLFVGDPTLRRALDLRIKTYRTEFLWLTLRGLFFSRRIDIGIVKSAFREDRTLFFIAPTLMLRAASAKLMGRPLASVS